MCNLLPGRHALTAAGVAICGKLTAAGCYTCCCQLLSQECVKRTQCVEEEEEEEEEEEGREILLAC
jgi:hypothetical protein